MQTHAIHAVNDAYFEFDSPMRADEALHILQEHLCGGECFAPYTTIQSAAHNCNPNVLRITLCPHKGDLAALAASLGALRVTENHEVIWGQN